MANVGGGRGETGGRTRPRHHVVEEVKPHSGWTEDSNFHYLLVDLPGFKKEEVKLEVDQTSQRILISGERLVNHNKYVYFGQEHKVPENSDIDNISGKFDGEILYIAVPKLAVVKEEKPEIENERENPDHRLFQDDMQHEPSDDGHNSQVEHKETRRRGSCIDEFGSETLRKWGLEPTTVERAMKMLRKNKGILVTAVLAFSLGVFVTRKFSTGAGDQ